MTIQPTPGIRGWLDTNGVCYFIRDTHTDFSAWHLKIKLPPLGTSNFLRAGLEADKKMYDKGWVRIVITPETRTLYFDTLNMPWKNLTRHQRGWLYDVATNGIEIERDKIVPGPHVLNKPLTITFGATNKNPTPDELIAESTSFFGMLKTLLTERMSFRDLYNASDPARVKRSSNVRARPIRVATMNKKETWTFRYKSNPSTTGNPWHGYIQFYKDSALNTENAGDVDCIVDCECPDYRYKWAYANTKQDASRIGRRSWNQCINSPPDQTNPDQKPGLCIAKGELVSTDKGFLPIELVSQNNKVWTLDGWRKIINCGQTGNKLVVEIKLKSGRSIKVTPNHKLLSFSELSGFVWIEAKQLTPDHLLCMTFPENIQSDYDGIEIEEYCGDKIYYPKQKIKMNETLSELMGYMISEGSKNGIFSNLNESLNIDFYNKWCQIFGEKSCIIRKEGCYVGFYGAKILERLGFICGSYFKEVPSWILRGDKKIVTSFLRGCYAGDGNFRNQHSTYATVSESLARNMHLLLGFLGVRTSLKCYHSGVNNSLVWVVRTSSMEETEKLYGLLSPIRGYSTYNNKIIRELQKHFSQNDYLIKNIRNFFKIRMREVGLDNNQCDSLMSSLKFPKTWKYNIHRSKIIPVIEQLKKMEPAVYDNVSLLSRRDVYFDRVITVVSSGHPVDVYDLTVDISEHFTVNGVVVHNCKHLISLGEYLKTKLDPTAPEPEDDDKYDPYRVTPKPKNEPISTPGATVQAPEPEDSYSDSRTGSDTLQEDIIGNHRSALYDRIEKFVNENPEFDVMYDDAETSNNLNEDYHHYHKNYRMYEGNTNIKAIFEDGSSLEFEVHYHDNRGDDKEKWRHKAFTKWKSLASKIHNDVELNEVGNPMQKSWRESFEEALEHPELQEYIRKPYHQRVFDDAGYPASVQGKPQPCIDPVNFTKMSQGCHDALASGGIETI